MTDTNKTEAPERIWRETIWPCAKYREGGVVLHESKPEERDGVRRKSLDEYVRRDLSRPAPVTVSRGALRKLVDESADAGMDRLETMEHILSALTPSPQLTEQEKQDD